MGGELNSFKSSYPFTRLRVIMNLIPDSLWQFHASQNMPLVLLYRIQSLYKGAVMNG